MKKPNTIPLGQNREETETHLLEQFDFDKRVDQEQVK